MSDLHDLCRFTSRPINEKYLENLKHYLAAGIPATYTIEEAYNYTNGIEDASETTTTPLHLIFTHVPSECATSEMLVVNNMVRMLLEYGAGWCLTDINDETPGCILLRRGLGKTTLYEQIVDAGVRAELLLRKVGEYDMEVIEDTDDLDHARLGVQVHETSVDQVAGEEGESGADQLMDKEEIGLTSESRQRESETEASIQPEIASENDSKNSLNDPSHNQQAYLDTKLEYKNGALVTESHQDGVMMEWESGLMQIGCESLFKGANDSKDPGINILNIGFGMGIIDTMISERQPTKHYICEAHRDVLAKMKQDGWYDKPNVVVLEGRWQDQLDFLLSLGAVYFDGIYYDTFSEHYSDMLELFDYVVGLMKPNGVFSFFNGLGADRQVIYEVYRKLVEIDLGNYGLRCEFQEVEVPKATLSKNGESVWDGVRRSYWLCPVFYHPEARFIDV